MDDTRSVFSVSQLRCSKTASMPPALHVCSMSFVSQKTCKVMHVMKDPHKEDLVFPLMFGTSILVKTNVHKASHSCDPCRMYLVLSRRLQVERVWWRSQQSLNIKDWSIAHLLSQWHPTTQTHMVTSCLLFRLQPYGLAGKTFSGTCPVTLKIYPHLLSL